MTLDDFERRNFLEYCIRHAPAEWTKNTLHLNLQNICKLSQWLYLHQFVSLRHKLEKKRYKTKRREIPSFTEIDSLFERLQLNYITNQTTRRKHHHQLYLITRILYETGCRISECLGIYLSDVEIRNGKYFVTLEGSKSYDSQRSVEIDKKLFDELKFYRDKYRIKARLFNNERGNQFSRHKYAEDIKKLGQSLEIQARIHAHLFRHLFILRLICEGKSVAHVMVRCGHKDAQMTLYYFDQVRRLYPDVEINPDVHLFQRQANQRKNIFKNLKERSLFDD